MLDSLMRQFSKEVEADPPMEATEPGVYEYLLEEDLPIVIKAMQPQGVLLTAVMGPYPKEKEEEFFIAMMAGNLFGKETFGATLGLDGDGKNMVLTRAVEQRLDYREFKALLEDFVHIVNFWRSEAGNDGDSKA
jgi:hypothetical protein